MDKNEILSEIDKASNCVEALMNSEGKSGLKVFIDDLKKLKGKVLSNDLVNNPLRGFARRYAEMYSDYLNPITDVLDKIEKSVDDYLDTN
ncbi:hypothetical protein [Erwinia amylovora]|uniref:hypothetical protein n=1 Tax=Erwinia amylovora TaxID=552 RepID=UPI003209C327